MSQMTWSRKGLKTLEVGRGGDKMEYLLAAALAVVIIGALVLTVYFAFIRKSSGGAEAGQFRWQCQTCGTEFTVDEITQGRLEEMDRPRAECPKCGSVQPVWPMVKCFGCGKFFVRESVKNPRKSVMNDTCPFCGKNWMQGLHERASGKK